MNVFFNPTTGVLLDADEDPRALATAIDDTWAEVDRLWAAALRLMEQRDKGRKLTMPPPRDRTATQQLVMRCPKCRGRFTVEDDPPAGEDAA